MRKHKLTLIVFAALITLAPTVAKSQTKCEPQQRKEFVATAVDKNGNVIDNLRAEHLRLKVGNSPATIADVAFQNDTQPLDIVILIDSSVSQEKVVPLAKAGALRFISSVATAGRDRVAVVSFSHKANTQPVLTSDFASAIRSVDQIEVDIPPGYIGGGVVLSASRPRKTLFPGSTALWDVIGHTTNTLFGANAEKRRRVMLLFSDGNDTASSSKPNRVTEDLIKHEIAVFSIGLADQIYGPSEGTLKKLSEQTGGVASFPKNAEAVETFVAEIGKRSRAKYVIGYCGEANTRGKLQLEVVDPELRKTKPILIYKRLEL